MLRPRQFAICGTLAATFWLLATLCIRFTPASVGPGPLGNVGFVASIPVGWLCIWATCRLARLAPHQIPAGCLVVLGAAMMIDGIALRWYSTIYAANDQTARLGAAWLLWGYGISAWIALATARSGQTAPL